ncbi:hypothetical protein [Azospirillum endophyticum]
MGRERNSPGQPKALPQISLNLNEALGRAYAHWNPGQADQAEMLCRHILQAWPGQTDALHLIGLMAHAFGNADLAIQYLRAACQAPRAPAIYFSNLAEMCRRRGLMDEAETAARRATALDSSVPAAWNNFGIILQETGKTAESAVCLERVANSDPNNREAHSNLSHLLDKIGRFDEAAEETRLAINLNPRLGDAYLNLAQAELARERPGDALHWTSSLPGMAPGHPGALAAQANILKKFGRPRSATTLVEQILASHPAVAGGEMTALQSVIAASGPYPQLLDSLEPASLAHLGEAYLAEVERRAPASRALGGAALRGQDAGELPPCRDDLAKRLDRPLPARSGGHLPVLLQHAVRRGTAVHLRPLRTGALLPVLRDADGPLA